MHTYYSFNSTTTWAPLPIVVQYHVNINVGDYFCSSRRGSAFGDGSVWTIKHCNATSHGHHC